LSQRVLWMILLSISLAGCSLAGDITPPAEIVSDKLGVTPTTDITAQQPEVEIPDTSPPERGSVTGVIENGTPGGSLPDNLEVNLVASDGQALVFSTETTADENGKFAFTDIEVVLGRIYLTYVDYQDVRYVSEGRHFSEGDSQLDLPLQIYETTEDDSGLRVSRMHVIFELADDSQIGVTQVWIIDGLEDRTVVEGDDAGVIDIRLPAGFSNLGIDDSISPEGRYLLSDTGFIDRLPVQPRKPVELVFGFTLPYKPGSDYSQTLMYPVDAVVIMLVSEEISVHADGLENLGRRDMAGISMRSYSMEALKSGDALTLRLGSKATMFQGENVLIGYISTAIVLAVLALVVFLRFGDKKRFTSDAAANSRNLHDDYQATIKAIAALDDAFEAGDLARDAYQQRRAKLKDQALHLMREEND
jgi:hypothetical protein